ncbi:hypothetical protein [Paracoccus luteus]|uniref:hypothetical protein n=1 Tax=Paracoccus luteus TaxID=2508543 RepID=UPI00106FF8AA|nr:hypothetical protein [Paracoccus luteus]
MKRLVAVAAAVATLSACADKSDSIAAAYVSPMNYQGMSCPQLAEEAQRVAVRAQQAAQVQDKKASNDAAATAVSLVLFWPAAFMIKGDGQTAAEVSRLKGEMQALEQANIQRKCGITFRRG